MLDVDGMQRIPPITFLLEHMDKEPKSNALITKLESTVNDHVYWLADKRCRLENLCSRWSDFSPSASESLHRKLQSGENFRL